MEKNTGTSEEDSSFSGNSQRNDTYIPEGERGYSSDSLRNEPSDTIGVTSAADHQKRSLWQKITRPFRSLRRSRPDGSTSKSRRFITKYWYVIVLLVLVAGSFIAWRAYEANIDAKWAKAADYYGRADYANASKQLEGLDAPKNDEKRLTMYAQTMLATRQLDKALPVYNDLYSVKKDPAVKIVIANIYNEQKKYDEAAKIYREVIASNESYVQAYVNLSTLYKLQNKSQDAIDIAKQGVKANPNSVVLNELLISMLLENKKSPEYKNAVETLKKINPQDPIFEAIKE